MCYWRSDLLCYFSLPPPALPRTKAPRNMTGTYGRIRAMIYTLRLGRREQRKKAEGQNIRGRVRRGGARYQDNFRDGESSQNDLVCFNIMHIAALIHA